MNQVSRRSFAESLAVAALAPLIGVRPEAIQLAAWTAPASHPVLDDPGGEESLLAFGIRYQERTGFHRLRPPGL